MRYYFFILQIFFAFENANASYYESSRYDYDSRYDPVSVSDEEEYDSGYFTDEEEESYPKSLQNRRYNTQRKYNLSDDYRDDNDRRTFNYFDNYSNNSFDRRYRDNQDYDLKRRYPSEYNISETKEEENAVSEDDNPVAIYLESLNKLKEDYQITGYNIYKLLGKFSPVNNSAKKKLNEYFGMNVKLLDTLDLIINKKEYPSLYLVEQKDSPTSSNENDGPNDEKASSSNENDDQNDEEATSSNENNDQNDEENASTKTQDAPQNPDATSQPTDPNKQSPSAGVVPPNGVTTSQTAETKESSDDEEKEDEKDSDDEKEEDENTETENDKTEEQTTATTPLNNTNLSQDNDLTYVQDNIDSVVFKSDQLNNNLPFINSNNGQGYQSFNDILNYFQTSQLAKNAFVDNFDKNNDYDEVVNESDIINSDDDLDEMNIQYDIFEDDDQTNQANSVNEHISQKQSNEVADTEDHLQNYSEVKINSENLTNENEQEDDEENTEESDEEDEQEGDEKNTKESYKENEKVNDKYYENKSIIHQRVVLPNKTNQNLKQKPVETSVILLQDLDNEYLSDDEQGNQYNANSEQTDDGRTNQTNKKSKTLLFDSNQKSNNGNNKEIITRPTEQYRNSSRFTTTFTTNSNKKSINPKVSHDVLQFLNSNNEEVITSEEVEPQYLKSSDSISNTSDNLKSNQEISDKIHINHF